MLSVESSIASLSSSVYSSISFKLVERITLKEKKDAEKLNESNTIEDTFYKLICRSGYRKIIGEIDKCAEV